MLVSCAYRPQAAARGVRRLRDAHLLVRLLLLLPVLHPDDVSGGAAWYARMVALLALGVYGVLAWPSATWLCGERVSAPARPGPARP